MTAPSPIDRPSLETRVAMIEDRLEIYNLIASHPPIVDSGDMTLMKDMFTAKGVIDRGPFGAVQVQGLPDGPNLDMEAAQADSGLVHLSTIPYLRLEGDTAVAVNYVAATVKEPFGDTLAVAAHGEGRGHRIFRVTANKWELEKADGRWRVQRRTLILADGEEPARVLMHDGVKAI